MMKWMVACDLVRKYRLSTETKKKEREVQEYTQVEGKMVLWYGWIHIDGSMWLDYIVENS